MKLPTSIRLDEETTRLWHGLAKKLGLPLAGVITLAIRKLAEMEHIK